MCQPDLQCNATHREVSHETPAGTPAWFSFPIDLGSRGCAKSVRTQGERPAVATRGGLPDRRQVRSPDTHGRSHRDADLSQPHRPASRHVSLSPVPECLPAASPRGCTKRIATATFAPAAWQSWKESDFGSNVVTSFEVVGMGDLTKQMKFISPDDGNPDDKTVFQVKLPRPVAPGAGRARSRFRSRRNSRK